jgi:mRNA-degrading endonuclease HigB of HigAB toxin-antitoxin module
MKQERVINSKYLTNPTNHKKRRGFMKNSYFCKFIFAFILLFVTSSGSLFAQQFTVSGVVTDATNGERLIGANVYFPDLNMGAATNENGEYSISVAPGKYTITCSYIGFDRIDEEINVNADMTLNFSMTEYQFTLSVTVFSDRVKERETPVAYTNIDKEQMKFNLGSRDIPLVMNTTPSVFATDQGGGAGDARINVRGFNQRNIGIMINGIPINDMENGWVYWSNWDGLGDATSSIEMQRGLSAINLATPSIGGTMNIITDPTQHNAGAFFQNEFGTGGFHKQTFFGHTGMVDKFAMSFGGVRKVGDGHADKVWTDAWAYYLGMAYEINSRNRLELYAMGAPQMHGQRRWKLNTATFSHELARELNFPDAALKDPRLREQGLLYNSNWAGINSSYNGMQWQRSYWNNDYNQRYDLSSMNESVNYFHKPLVNLNWFSQFSDVFSLYTTVYYSGGQGGGTGTFGSLNYDFSLLQRVVDWDSTIEENRASLVYDDPYGTGDSTFYAITTDRRNDPNYNRSGILRNSVNSQWTIGGISKAYWKVSKTLNTSFGIDVRKAEIDHYREVRDLLGNDFYHYNGNEFESGTRYFKKLGDHIDYDNTNSVTWIGSYVQAEWTKNIFTLYGTAGYTQIKYEFVDHFRMDASGGELTLEPGWLSGYQFKGGANVQLFVNAGYVSKVPVLDGVISDWNSKLIENPKNEKFISGEIGANTNWLQNKLTLNGNVYFTDWSDRVDNEDVGGDLVRLFDVSSRHMGVELEGAWQPVRFIRFDAAFSYGIWEYTDDVNGVYIFDAFPDSTVEQNAYIKDLKVGDAPQTQLAASVTIFPVPGMQAMLLWRSYSNYYSQFDPVSRDNPDDREQVWQIPAYNLLELHFSYLVPAQVLGLDVTLFAHVFNLTNLLYVQDAVDNSSFNAWRDSDFNIIEPHKASAAEIYPGAPTSFNFGFSAAL